jgi:hypothetical protein
MRRIRIVGLCLIAVFAVVAVAATSASAAEPEWGHCVAQKKGEYTEGNCKTKSAKAHKGKFEWISGAVGCYAQKKGEYTNSSCTSKSAKAHKGKYEKTGGGKFTGAAGAGVLNTFFYGCEHEYEGTLTLNARVPHEDCTGEPYGFDGILSSVIPVECESEHASGESAGSDEVTNVSVRFKGCVASGLPATTHGLPAGEIQVNQLKGRLGYINKSAHEVGVLLEPAAAGGQFAEFEVVEGEVIQHVGEGNATEGAFYEEAHGAPTGNDGIISPIVPVNQMTHTFTQNYRTELINSYEPVSCHVSPTCLQHGGAEEGGGNGDVLNIPSHFEGGQLEALEVYQENVEKQYGGTSWDPAGEEITNVNTVEGEAEIKG